MYNIDTIRHLKPPKIREFFLEMLAFQQYIYILPTSGHPFTYSLMVSNNYSDSTDASDL